MAQRSRTAAPATATADLRSPLLSPSPSSTPGPAAPPSTSSEPTTTADAPLTPSSSSTSSSAISLNPASPSRPLIEGQSFTLRGVLVGLGVGLIICFSNMYFGLQTGWVSIMSMPASLMGFGVFRLLTQRLKFPFSPVENVLVQTVAGSMAIMPLGCGFVGVIPAMQFLLRDDESGGNGPGINLGLGKLVVWGLGLCYFGVVFGVPLRRQVIIREQLKFPSGFSTAVLISVLHGKTRQKTGEDEHEDPATFASLAGRDETTSRGTTGTGEVGGMGEVGQEEGQQAAEPHSASWKRNLNLLLVCFLVSGIFTLSTYFVPALRSIPIFGSYLATTWLWTLNPSLAYVGQGIIMGPATTLHMLLGAVIGWGVLSPLAKNRGWAPGDVDDWEKGSKGWIVWVSLAIMLADSVVSLGWLAGRSVVRVQGVRKAVKWAVVQGRGIVQKAKEALSQGGNKRTTRPSAGGRSGYRAISTGTGPIRPRLGRRLSDISEASNSEDDENEEYTHLNSGLRQRHSSGLAHIHEDVEDEEKEEEHDDAPPDQQVSDRTVIIGLIASILFCIGCIHFVFGNLVPLYATVTAVFMALVLSIMGVRALGETDLNPVSGISKLAQLFFAFIIPQSNKNSVLINLVAGAVSEAGALQAGDLMQDLKTGHLLGAAPKAQFYGQVIGATVGAVVSAFIYKLYTVVYTIPGSLFQVPTGYVWIFTARLVTGEGLPPMAKEWAMGSAMLFAVTTAARIVVVDKAVGGDQAKAKRWQALIPGGIAVAVGMYNVPSFTIARTLGDCWGGGGRG
ncbi:OPT oligopeptide transporter protein-domain-containing protein [Sordaria brevicollis]|uniref:OPT oligopeptide transporter protein-domain-containing protein n=1 Tax=Sordaria brevicollis TaxID=83679 RepID=A0AAE0UAN7_SORBR|nr:OPT oligopeptide transporter protein-domain-containing protein [Sordaria brevicollis]